MSEARTVHYDPVAAAIARGSQTAANLEDARAQLIQAMEVVAAIGGGPGLDAMVLGCVMYVKGRRGLQP
jgi:glycerol dehydrogenase-like iron-containing ADH family enzyme